MTEQEIIAAIKAAGYASEMSLEMSELKYPMTLNLYQSTAGRFSGRLIGPYGTVFTVTDVEAPEGILEAVNEAGYSLSYVIKVHS